MYSSNESDNDSGSLHNAEDKDEVTTSSHQPQQQEASNENDDKLSSIFNQDRTASSKESSVEPLKRRSVIFSPDTKELDSDEPNNRQSLSTSQTIKDAKEILKKSNSGYSFSSALTSESDRSDNDALSTSSRSSSDVDMLESRVSQLESGLITEHAKPESKDDQVSPSKLSDDQSSSKLSDSSNVSKVSSGGQNSDHGSNGSGSQSEVDQNSSAPSDQKLLDNKSSKNDDQSSKDDDQSSKDSDQSISQLSQHNQASSHSLDRSKPFDGDNSTTEVDQNVSHHDQLPIPSPKDNQTTPDLSEIKEIDQTNNQNDHAEQDTNQTTNQQGQNSHPDQANNQQSQNDDQDASQHNKHDQSDQAINQHEDTTLSDQGTNQHNQENSHQSETTTSDPIEQDHNAS